MDNGGDVPNGFAKQYIFPGADKLADIDIDVEVTAVMFGGDKNCG